MNFFLSYQLSAVSFQTCFLIIFNPSVDWDKSPESPPLSSLKHPTHTLTPTRTPNWGGKDIILPHLSQMFLKNYASGHTVFLCTYGAGNGF
jgi:hypothetical protein